jgi:hypothetical protein
MTNDEMVAMAKQAGCMDADEYGWWITDAMGIKELTAFAKLVAEKEREACARICDDQTTRICIDDFQHGLAMGADNCATAIKARGKK